MVAVLQCFKDAKQWLNDLQAAVASADVADYAIRQGKLSLGPKPVGIEIAKIERTAGRFRGISKQLESIGPFSIKIRKKN